MPEGPCVRRWGDTARQFLHKEIVNVSGASKVVDHDKWKGASINDVTVYGKQLFFQLVKTSDDDTEKGKRGKKTENSTSETTKTSSVSHDASIWYRYHFLMWGSLRANEYKGPSKRSKTQVAPKPMIEFHFPDKSFLLFYGGSVRVVDGPCDDEGIDVLSSTFDIEEATAAILRPFPLCYTIMDQAHFAGAGNIVKNEVLYACRMHPLELGCNLTRTQAAAVAQEVVRFTKDWQKWEEESSGYQRFGTWMKMYWKFQCPDGHKTKRGWFGDKLKRMTVWCPECQPLRIESDIATEEMMDPGKKKKGIKIDSLEEDNDQSPDKTRERKEKRKRVPLKDKKKGTSKRRTSHERTPQLANDIIKKGLENASTVQSKRKRASQRGEQETVNKSAQCCEIPSKRRQKNIEGDMTEGKRTRRGQRKRSHQDVSMKSETAIAVGELVEAESASKSTRKQKRVRLRKNPNRDVVSRVALETPVVKVESQESIKNGIDVEINAVLPSDGFTPNERECSRKRKLMIAGGARGFARQFPDVTGKESSGKGKVSLTKEVGKMKTETQTQSRRSTRLRRKVFDK
ncbi:uncharacterized protein [Diadema antillarum]|uniref:uncharacterized protein n=1 Tax=Diadema antillarum TaxID=105358 RepID=UPI003A84CA7A